MNFTSGDQDDVSCNDYYVLSDATRNLGYGIPSTGVGGWGFCDNPDDDTPSSDWHGPGWYRLGMPAGITIPEEPVQSFHCNTIAPGWLNGNHPTPGNTVNGTVCFVDSFTANQCEYQTQIQIKHCNNYFLYYLPVTPACNTRYCASTTTLISR